MAPVQHPGVRPSPGLWMPGLAGDGSVRVSTGGVPPAQVRALPAARAAWRTPAGPVICPTGPTCNTWQARFTLLSLDRGGHYTAFCFGCQQPNIESSPQHTEQPLWSETIYIHFCAIVFSGTRAGYRGRQKKSAGALDSLQTKITGKGQIRVKQICHWSGSSCAELIITP